MEKIDLEQLEDIKKHLASHCEQTPEISTIPEPKVIEAVRFIYVAINRYKTDIRKVLETSSEPGYKKYLSDTLEKVSTIEDCTKAVIDCLESKE